MFYHYSNGDCRIIESSHIYESFGAEICPSCKCNEMYSSDFTKNYAICYETECVQNYLYSDNIDDNNYNYLDNKFYSDYGAYNAIRIKISDDGYSKYEYITCWAFESNQYKVYIFTLLAKYQSKKNVFNKFRKLRIIHII